VLHTPRLWRDPSIGVMQRGERSTVSAFSLIMYLQNEYSVAEEAL